MWKYDFVTREEFDAAKDRVEEIMLRLGAEKYDIELPYEQKTTNIFIGVWETFISHRSVYTFRDEFYWVDEVLFRHKPFIVIEYGSRDDLLSNTMADADPFPYDLTGAELEAEVKLSMGIK